MSTYVTLGHGHDREPYDVTAADNLAGRRKVSVFVSYDLAAPQLRLDAWTISDFDERASLTLTPADALKLARRLVEGAERALAGA